MNGSTRELSAARQAAFPMCFAPASLPGRVPLPFPRGRNLFQSTRALSVSGGGPPPTHRAVLLSGSPHDLHTRPAIAARTSKASQAGEAREWTTNFFHLFDDLRPFVPHWNFLYNSQVSSRKFSSVSHASPGGSQTATLHTHLLNTIQWLKKNTLSRPLTLVPP